jgi:hypothetical protein
MHALRAFAVFAVILLATPAPGADVRPHDTSKPLFRVLAPTKVEQSAKGPVLTVGGEHPLLVVWSVRDLSLGRDGKSVLITLQPNDAKLFAAATQKYNHGLLVLEGDGRVLQAMYVTNPVLNGVMSFKHPDDAAVAEYLRRRFRIGEFR